LYNPDDGLSVEGRKRIEDAIVAALTGAGEEVAVALPRKKSLPRSDQILTIIRTHVKRIGSDDLEWYRRVYPPRLEQLSEDDFQTLAGKLEDGMELSMRVDEVAAEFRALMFRPCIGMLDLLLGQFLNPPGSGGLFGDAGE
jgi:hypothetical protein